MTTKYSIVYSNNRKNIISSTQYEAFGYPDSYECAAVKEVYNQEKLIHKDSFVDDKNWIDVKEADFINKAIQKRGL